MWARIEKHTVREIIDIDPAGRYHADIKWILIPDDVPAAVGWGWDGTQFSPPAPPTAEETREILTSVVQNHMNAVCAARGYGTGRTEPLTSACSYAGYDNPFRGEGEAAITWRSAVWIHCYQVLADVEADVRQIPTAEELIAELPAIAWPA